MERIVAILVLKLQVIFKNRFFLLNSNLVNYFKKLASQTEVMLKIFMHGAPFSNMAAEETVGAFKSSSFGLPDFGGSLWSLWWLGVWWSGNVAEITTWFVFPVRVRVPWENDAGGRGGWGM